MIFHRIKYFIFLILWVFLTAGSTHDESKGRFSYFMRSLNTRSYGYQVVSAPHPIRAGKSSERFEVRPGDCGANSSGWNDCYSDRERSELSEQKPYSTVGGEYWYGWSIFVPENWQNIYPAKTALGQFHQKAQKRPPVMFQNHTGGYWLDLNQINGSPDKYYMLIPKEQFRGQWHDIVINARWSQSKDGFIKIWVNGLQKVAYSGPLTLYGDPIYFKYGVYRSFISRYKKKKTSDSMPTQVAYFDEVRKGVFRNEVDPALNP